MLEFVLVSIALIFPLLLTLWYQNFSRYFTLLKKIPGPPGYPVIGNVSIYKTHEEHFQNDREKSEKYYPIYKTWSLFYGGVTLLHPDDIELVLSSRKHIYKGFIYTFLHSWLGTGLISSNGTKWRTRRKMVTPAFHFSNLRKFVDIFGEETKKLVENLKHHKDTKDIQDPISEFTILAIIRTSIGDVGSIESRNYKKAVEDFMRTVPYRILRPWFFNDTIFFKMSKLGKLTKMSIETLHHFSHSVITKTKKLSTKKQTLLDILLAEKKLGDDGIREEVDTFIFAGHDTTCACLCYTLLLLANHRHIQDKVFEEIKDHLGYPIKTPNYDDLKQLSFLERCIKETLRLYPSVPSISRTLSEDLRTTTGYIIPKGVVLHINFYDLHRNPEIYPDPEKFDPDRFLPENMRNRHPFGYLPFSAGPRNCIGQKYAILELKMALCAILGSFILEANEGPRDLVFMKDIILRCKGGIKVRFKLRDSTVKGS